MISGNAQVIHFNRFSQAAVIYAYTMYTEVKGKHKIFDFVSLLRRAYTERTTLVKTKNLAFTSIDDA